MQLKNLRTKFLGRNVIEYDVIDSTQNEIWRLIEKKSIDNGTVVMANIQTNARGTHGRVWYTDEGDNIAFSMYMCLDSDVKVLDGLTIKIAKHIVDICKRKYNVCLDIKEPNDIMYKDKKIGGILTETKIVGTVVTSLVIGIGINTNKENFNENIESIATSIKKEFGVDVDNSYVISQICNKLEEEILYIYEL